MADGKVVGSSLIGQQGYSLDYFQPRPANGLGTNSVNTQYTLILSGATNLSADSKVLVKQVKDAKAAVVKDNSTADYKVKPSQVPADAVTSSGSGLDPDISPAYAELQVHRVAERNRLSVTQVQKLVKGHTDGRTLGFIGEPTVNVLELNIALKALVAKS
nr:potassium-transporting ATPase subunit C [Streptomyces sp. NBC_00886]